MMLTKILELRSRIVLEYTELKLINHEYKERI